MDITAVPVYGQVWVSMDKLKHLRLSLFGATRVGFTILSVLLTPLNKRKTTEADYDCLVLAELGRDE